MAAAPAAARSPSPPPPSLDPLTPPLAAVVRMGMTAAVNIDLYRNPERGLVAPGGGDPREATPDTYVLVQRQARRGATSRRPVRIGQVGPLGVEVLSGLKAGDRVVWRGQATTDDDAPD